MATIIVLYFRHSSKVRLTTSNNENTYSILPSHNSNNPHFPSSLQPTNATETRSTLTVLPNKHSGCEARVRTSDDGQVHHRVKTTAHLQQEGTGQCDGHRHQTGELHLYDSSVANIDAQGESAPARENGLPQAA